MSEWFSNEAFWADLYDYLFGQDKFDRSEEELKDLLELIEFKGLYILDLCCLKKNGTIDYSPPPLLKGV